MIVSVPFFLYLYFFNLHYLDSFEMSIFQVIPCVVWFHVWKFLFFFGTRHNNSDFTLFFFTDSFV
uniref:Putative ovule protein n=1 Tax=Solanum chacoense TaxID=4108 RepID=A0A0V0IVQ5_SOLCH